MLKVNRTARYAKIQPYLFEAIKVEFSVEGESHKKIYIKKKTSRVPGKTKSTDLIIENVAKYPSNKYKHNEIAGR